MRSEVHEIIKHHIRHSVGIKSDDRAGRIIHALRAAGYDIKKTNNKEVTNETLVHGSDPVSSFGQHGSLGRRGNSAD